MLDSKGRQIRLGDRLTIGGGIAGVVVCSIDTDEYSPSFPKDAWGYLGCGIMVQTETAGLIHLNESDEDIEGSLTMEQALKLHEEWKIPA